MLGLTRLDQRQNRAGFQFLNSVGDGGYTYDNSFFGAASIDFTKETDSGTRWKLTLVPQRSNQAVMDGSNSPVHEASVSVPLTDLQTRFIAGFVPDWSGYEYLQPTLNKLITHNLLFDLTLPTLTMSLMDDAGITGPARSLLARALDRKDAAAVQERPGEALRHGCHFYRVLSDEIRLSLRETGDTARLCLRLRRPELDTGHVLNETIMLSRQDGMRKIVKALKDSGWFVPVERENLQNLLTERKIVRALEMPQPADAQGHVGRAGELLGRQRAGFHAVDGGVEVMSAINRHWVILGSARVSQLQGDARRSPLTVEPVGYSVSVGLAYRCCR